MYYKNVALGNYLGGSAAHSGANDFKWIKQRLYNLGETSITFDDGREEGLAGALIGSFRIDNLTGEAVVRTNPELRALWESITHLEIEQRRSLGQNQLAKAMHAMLASHVMWMPIRLDTLMARVGAEVARISPIRSSSPNPTLATTTGGSPPARSRALS